MSTKRNLALILGLSIAIGGSIEGIKYHHQKQNMITPVVSGHIHLQEELDDACKAWNSLPAGKRIHYNPQKSNKNYSVSQAHSKTEQAYQRLEFAKSNLKESGENQEVKRYIQTSNNSFLGFLSIVPGLILSYFGIRRKD